MIKLSLILTSATLLVLGIITKAFIDMFIEEQGALESNSLIETILIVWREYAN